MCLSATRSNHIIIKNGVKHAHTQESIKTECREAFREVTELIFSNK